MSKELRDYDKLTPRERREKRDGCPYGSQRGCMGPTGLPRCANCAETAAEQETAAHQIKPDANSVSSGDPVQMDDELCIVRNEASRLRPANLPPCRCAPCCAWRRKEGADGRFAGPSDSWEQPYLAAIYRKWGII